MTRIEYSLAGSAVAAFIALAGCNVVDESEVVAADPAFLDQCVTSGARVAARGDARRVSFEILSDDTNASAAGCGLTGLTGPDGVFLFESPQEAEWRIVAVPTDADIALYINDECDASDCLIGRNRCGFGLPESFAFVAPTAQNVESAMEDRLFSLALDTLTPDFAGTVSVTMARPLADGQADIGEACDDGNLVDGDGCDLEQRVELFVESIGSRTSEIEPNDDYHLANRLRFGPPGTSTVNPFVGTQTITGTAGGCDDDVFLVNLEEGRSLSVSLDSVSETPLRVRFFTVDRRNQVVEFVSRTGTSFTTSLPNDAPPGQYYMEIGLIGESMTIETYSAELRATEDLMP